MPRACSTKASQNSSSQCGNAKSCCHLHSELPLNEMFVRDSLGSAQTGEEKHPDIDDQHPNFVHLVHSKKVVFFLTCGNFECMPYAFFFQ